MPIKTVDLNELVDKGRAILMNGPHFHTWLHVYQPGQHDEMHCHNADQLFYSIDGECTMVFPDGGSQVLKPGCIALITGGSFYQLWNKSDRPMVLLGARGLSHEETLKIDYETREKIVYGEGKSGVKPTGTRILV